MPIKGALGYALSFRRDVDGGILSDNFDDESLDPAWTYEEGVAGNSGAEQNDRYEIVAAAESYAHIQRLMTTDNVVIIAKVQCAVKNQGVASWAGALGIWFNAYDWYALKLNTGGLVIVREYDANGTVTATNSTFSIAIGTWYWLKIVITSTQVLAYVSTSGITWTLLFTDTRAATWTINASTLVILGTGTEVSAASYPNLDWDNNYTSTGLNNTWYFDDLIVMRSEDIIAGLPDNWYFEVWTGGVLKATSQLSQYGQAILYLTSLENILPFDQILIYDENNVLIQTITNTADVWGGDKYEMDVE